MYDSEGVLDIAICDDLPMDAKNFSLKLEQIFKHGNLEKIRYKITKHYQSGEEALKELETRNHDIIFMDVEMHGGIDGFETAKRIKKLEKKALIIFLTTHVARGADAFPAGGFRYLGKDYDENKFVEAITAAVKKINSNQKVVIHYRNEFGDLAKKIVFVNDITHIESDKKKSFVYTKTEKISSNRPLKYWEELLDKNRFYRAHNAYLVNFVNVIDIKVKERWVYLASEITERIEASRNYVKGAHHALHEYFLLVGRGLL